MEAIGTLILLGIIAIGVCLCLWKLHKGPAIVQTVGGKADAIITDLEALVAKHKGTP